MSIRTWSGAGVLLIFLLGGAQPSAAPTRVELSVRPRYQFQPGTAFVTVKVERDPENRWLLLEADGPDYYRASYRQLEGASSPRIQQLALKALPSGTYVITVTVMRADGSRHQASSTIDVRGQEEDMRPEPLRQAR